MNKTLLDRYDLERFIDAQTDSFESALLELQAGEKAGYSNLPRSLTAPIMEAP